MFAAALVEGRAHPDAPHLVGMLLEPAVQEALARHHFHPVREGVPSAPGLLPANGAREIEVDWAEWRSIESRLGAYVVSS